MRQLPRHRVLVAAIVVAIASVASWGDLDWSALADAGHALFHAGGLHVYANHSELQAGPPTLVVFAGLSRIGQDAATVVTHIAMWLLFGWGLFAANRRAGDGPTQHPAPVRVPRVFVVGLAALPALVWNLPPFSGSEALLWGASLAILGLLLALPTSARWLRTPTGLHRVELFALLLAGTFAALASGTAHLEDAVAIALLVWAASNVDKDSPVKVALAVGLAMAFKPWAVAGAAVLLRRERPLVVLRDLAIAGAVVVGSWLPFVLAAHGTLNSASNRFPINGISTLTLIGFGNGTAPGWIRTMQLGGIIVVAIITRRAGALESVAAGMCTRLLLDPASFPYYLATMLFAVGAADLSAGRSPRRLMAAMAGTWLLPCFVTDLRVVAALRTLTLLGVLGSYVWTAVRSGPPTVAVARRPEVRRPAEVSV